MVAAVEILGEFKTDDLSLSAIAELAPKAQKLVDEVGYNE